MRIGDYIEFEINGNGFLKQMVRNIVGTFLQIEMGLRHEDSISSLLTSRERLQAGPSVQPQGLYLTRVYYPAELDNLAVPL
jgi:tRNA pseudouridine38-40 synthase